MVKSDAWKRRPSVLRYWDYKDELNALVEKHKFILANKFEIIFYLPMPISWSYKKTLLMIGKPHQQTPDFDNLVKGFTDALCKKDQTIYQVTVGKYWGHYGKIEVEQ